MTKEKMALTIFAQWQLMIVEEVLVDVQRSNRSIAHHLDKYAKQGGLHQSMTKGIAKTFREKAKRLNRAIEAIEKIHSALRKTRENE